MNPVYQAVRFSQAMLSSSALLLLGLILLFVLAPEVSIFGQLGWHSLSFGVLAGIVLYLLMFWLTKLSFLNSASIRQLMQKLASLFRNFSWPAIFVISAMAGIGEELLLRGLLQHYMVKFTNPAIGIIGASLVFGLMHYLSRVYVLVTFVLGMALGVAYHITQSLAFVMVAHAVYDVFAFAVLVKFPHMLGLNKPI